MAKRAGVAKGTIYLYFHNKDELYMAVLEYRARMWVEAIAGVLESRRDPFTVSDIVAAISGHILDSPGVLILGTLANGIEEHDVGRDEEMRFRTSIAFMAAQVGAVIEDGLPGLAAGQGAALFLRSIAYSLGVWQLIQPAKVMEEIRRRDELSPLRMEFGKELAAGLTSLWIGSLQTREPGFQGTWKTPPSDRSKLADVQG